MNQAYYSDLGVSQSSVGAVNDTIVDWGQSMVRDYDGGIGAMASSLMCSDLCPCRLSQDEANEWLNMEE